MIDKQRDHSAKRAVPFYAQECRPLVLYCCFFLASFFFWSAARA
jgi:hypothetical protein